LAGGCGFVPAGVVDGIIPFTLADRRAFYAERGRARAAEAAHVAPVLAEVAGAQPQALAPILARLVAEQLRRLR
jgi:hypothetical protein